MSIIFFYNIQKTVKKNPNNFKEDKNTHYDT